MKVSHDKDKLKSKKRRFPMCPLCGSLNKTGNKHCIDCQTEQEDVYPKSIDAYL